VPYRIGITGGSGYIGRSLGKHLSHGHMVRLLDIRQPEWMTEGSEYVNCDVTAPQSVETGIRDIDLVIHCAIVQIPLINEQRRTAYEVNVTGTANICKMVDRSPRVKGMILSGSWHSMGERELRGTVDEEFGFRPDKVEDRARLYALSKIAQESMVRFYDEMSEKVFGIVRMGTVLGENMPRKTAANIFMESALRGEAITAYKHSMHRPMLYVDIADVCRAYRTFAVEILSGEIKKTGSSLGHIVNVFYPEPITIIELAQMVQTAVLKHTKGAVCPKIEIVDTGQEVLFDERDKREMKVDVSKAATLLGLRELKSPAQSVEEIVKARISGMKGKST
jgi:UDP-glucose 4-epimerase